MRQLNSPPTPTLESLFGTNASSYHYCTFRLPPSGNIHNRSDCSCVTRDHSLQHLHFYAHTLPPTGDTRYRQCCHKTAVLSPAATPFTICTSIHCVAQWQHLYYRQYCHQQPLPVLFVHPHTALSSGNIHITDSTSLRLQYHQQRPHPVLFTIERPHTLPPSGDIHYGPCCHKTALATTGHPLNNSI